MIEIKKIRIQDYNKARLFSIEGMHTDRYVNSKLELYIYSKYVWFQELSRSTIALGAYDNDNFVGFLLADMHDEPKIQLSLWHRFFIKFITLFMNIFYADSSDPYAKANKEMLDNYTQHNSVDGELVYFAVDPKLFESGIGTMLLNELEKSENGKNVFLYTDSGSTYQFYEHRGFEKVGEKKIVFTVGKKKVPLTCMMYVKVMSH